MDFEGALSLIALHQYRRFATWAHAYSTFCFERGRNTGADVGYRTFGGSINVIDSVLDRNLDKQDFKVEIRSKEPCASLLPMILLASSGIG